MSATTVGLGLIARDEEPTLPRPLVLLRRAFDEVVLVDTGSTDATVERFEAWAATQPTRTVTSCRRVDRRLRCRAPGRAVGSGNGLVHLG